MKKTNLHLRQRWQMGCWCLLMILAFGRCDCGPTPSTETNGESSHQETSHLPDATTPDSPLSESHRDRTSPVDTSHPTDQNNPDTATSERRPPGDSQSGKDDSNPRDQVNPPDKVQTPDTATPEKTQPENVGPDTPTAPLGPVFRYGINLGHRNASWGDDLAGQLAAAVGVDSTRKKLPEYHLDRWGYGIEVNDLKDHAANGINNHVGFLIGATEAHSTKPANEPSWKLDEYIPKNLYKPVFVNGQINPENYWGAYVYKTVAQYKDWIKIWEVWNEPDWVPDWRTTQGWTQNPPKASELPRFNGSIFDYIRLLRVTSEAAKAADPKALVALGGIGYTSFFSAILRYTDNPNAGTVTAEYPKKGGAYFDVLNIHYYPVFGQGNSDVGVDGFIQKQIDMAAELKKAGIASKLWNATETGAPHEKITGRPGGTAYAINYLIKVMVTAQILGFLGVDWFVLSDSADPGKSTDPFAYMGLYFDILNLKTISEAKRTETGWAYKTLGNLMKGSRYNPNATQALQLPAQAKGAAFRLADGRTAFILWAYDPKNPDETVKATYTLRYANPLTGYAWDYSRSQKTTTHSPNQGAHTLQLTSSPIILIGP